jgi:hypothetical protein
MHPGKLFDVLIRAFALAMIAGASAGMLMPVIGPLGPLAIGFLLMIVAGMLARMIYGRGDNTLE